jgi:ArsR family transcriptional regulator
MDIQRMRDAAQAACDLLKSLSNSDRLMLTCQLSQGELCVSELHTLLGISQPTLSQQLGVLRECQILATRREGKNIYYSIKDERALSVINAIFNIYCPTNVAQSPSSCHPQKPKENSRDY